MGYPTETDSLHRQARTATGLGQPAISYQPSAHSIIRATLKKSSYGMMLMVNGIKLLMVLAFYHCDCRYSNSTDDQRAYSYRTI